MANENCIYTMQQAAEKLGISRPKLFKFLKRYGIIVDGRPRKECELMGYFVCSTVSISNSTFQKNVNVIYVRSKGIIWIKRVMNLFEINLNGFVD